MWRGGALADGRVAPIEQPQGPILPQAHIAPGASCVRPSTTKVAPTSFHDFSNLFPTPAAFYHTFWTTMQSLLFCPDEKSARTLTLLVETLDIVVKREREVYSATRSLMAEAFDFLIVDCEDEPTGRLLLRNAHGSAINKGALAVAVVAPETGANALRFGADFLITKPVIAGHAGKVLRRVRTSILRRQKSSPEKTGTQTTPVKTEAPSSQSSSLDLATPVISSSVEQPAEAFSDQQAAKSSTSMAEPETANAAINPLTDANKKIQDSQGGNEQAPLQEELPIKLSLAAGPEPADPTPTAEVESAPQEEPTTKSQHVANQAATEIKKIQPRLFLVSLATAAGVILFIGVVVAWRIDFEHSLIDGRTPVLSSTNTSTTTAPVQVTLEPRTNEAPALASATVAAAPRQWSIVNTSKPGPAPEIRRIKVASSGKSPMGVQSVPLTATVSVSSDPPAAALWMDGSDTGRMTPAQIVVGKSGNHTFVLKKQGYLDETLTTNLRMGQTFHLAPSLRALGRTDEVKMVGTFSRFFGGSATAQMGTVGVKTQPKGAQIAVNTRILDKTSPAEFYLNPGNYVIDVTLPGFKKVHRVVSVDKGGKVAIDEVMDQE